MGGVASPQTATPVTIAEAVEGTSWTPRPANSEPLRSVNSRSFLESSFSFGLKKKRASISRSSRLAGLSMEECRRSGHIRPPRSLLLHRRIQRGGRFDRQREVRPEDNPQRSTRRSRGLRDESAPALARCRDRGVCEYARRDLLRSRRIRKRTPRWTYREQLKSGMLAIVRKRRSAKIGTIINDRQANPPLSRTSSLTRVPRYFSARTLLSLDDVSIL